MAHPVHLPLALQRLKRQGLQGKAPLWHLAGKINKIKAPIPSTDRASISIAKTKGEKFIESLNRTRLTMLTRI
jgi:hypothetical protein